MEVGFCTPRPILQPCSLEGHTYQVDPYIGCEHDCHYCYAQNDAEVDWPRQILIHRDLEQRLALELEGVEPQSIYMGMNSDPYQPAEGRRLQTRKVLELLAERGFSVCVLTKSPLIARDLDLFKGMPDPYLGFSIAFQDEDARGLFEGRAPTNAERLRGLRALRAAGIRTYALICPVMPFITDVEGIIDLVAPLVSRIYVYRIEMKTETDANWQHVKRILERHDAKLVDEYRRIAFSPEHPYWIELRSRLSALSRPSGVELAIEV